jgi:hypothetical protein
MCSWCQNLFHCCVHPGLKRWIVCSGQGFQTISNFLKYASKATTHKYPVRGAVLLLTLKVKVRLCGLAKY